MNYFFFQEYFFQNYMLLVIHIPSYFMKSFHVIIQNYKILPIMQFIHAYHKAWYWFHQGNQNLIYLSHSPRIYHLLSLGAIDWKLEKKNKKLILLNSPWPLWRIFWVLLSDIHSNLLIISPLNPDLKYGSKIFFTQLPWQLLF